MNVARSSERAEAAGQATYGISNLRPKTTGLPFIVFLSQKDDASHAARVKWSPMPKVVATMMDSNAIEPFSHKAGPRLAAEKEGLLRRWVSLNRDVLAKYWGEIAYTEGAVEQLKSIETSDPT